METITTWLSAATISQTPTAFLTGIFLALFSVSSLLLSTSLIKTVRLAGFTCGLISQPFWFYTAIDSYNLGLFINSIFFSGMWIYRFTPAFRSLIKEGKTTERETNARHFGGCKFDGWQCFHCGEVFETVGGARVHFGADPTKEPGCLIKIKYGDERGLEMELRKVEAERDALQYQISNESTQADLAIQRMQAEHQIALRREEEKGYARGLDDGKKLSPDCTGAPDWNSHNWPAVVFCDGNWFGVRENWKFNPRYDFKGFPTFDLLREDGAFICHGTFDGNWEKSYTLRPAAKAVIHSARHATRIDQNSPGITR